MAKASEVSLDPKGVLTVKAVLQDEGAERQLGLGVWWPQGQCANVVCSHLVFNVGGKSSFIWLKPLYVMSVSLTIPYDY